MKTSNSTDSIDRAEPQTGVHLLMACIASIFGVLVSLAALAMSWELWTIPLMAAGSLAVWWMHIGRAGSERLYEYLCSGLLLVEIFYYGVHVESLFELPVPVCILLLLFSLLDRKWPLYLTIGIYVSEMMYHILFIQIRGLGLRGQDIVRVGLGAAGTLCAMVISAYCVNRRKEEKERFVHMLSQLEAAGKQNADFLSNMSHELRTPINMVNGISEVILGKDISPELKKDVQSVQMAGRRLSAQINNILDYTEIVGGTLTASKESYMISSVVNDLITMTAMQNNTHGLEIVFDVDTRIPSVLIGDAEKITRILKIVLENAIKFTEDGGINVRIGFRSEKYGVNLDIDICDTGIGMTASQLLQIYNDFYQADSGSRLYAGGLGLGIPIARGLLRSMGGFIHCESKDQQGLQVHITIPQGVGEDAPCITVENPERFCIACYFKADKYRSEVRGYYDVMLQHMAEGLGIEGYRAYHPADLENLRRNHELTHVIIGQVEYEENRARYEDLARVLSVIVIAEKSFVLPRESRLLVLRKPFFTLSVANLLGGQAEGTGENPAAEKSLSCEGIRALAVDDEEMNLMVAKGILGRYGMEVDTCLSGRAAVEQCTNTVYDLIFLDHMMPGMDGVETLKRIRELGGGSYRNLPIIALTANTVSGAREMFKREGFTEFVPKPIERSALERVLRRVLPENVGIPAGAAPEKIPAAGEALPVEEPFAVLRQAGIHVETGLDYSGGDEEFYWEVLKMFCEQSADKREEIISLYEAENWADYAVKVHALKSTSLTIGAELLSDQAKALEQAGKEKNVAYIRKNHFPVLGQYKKVCESIRSCIGGENISC